jgi:arylsulfatase
VDTLRADHLGCYRYSRDTSVQLDRLCEESIVFEKAMAPAPYTIASYTSILTGLYQRDHRVYSNYQKADESLETLPERLQAHGYRTAAILEGSFPGTFANLDQGFDLVIQRGVVARSSLPSLSETGRSLFHATRSIAAGQLRWNISVTTDAAERWLREQTLEQPLFVHFYWPFPHQPYHPPAEHLKTLPLPTPGDLDSDRIRAYDGEILFTDAQMGRLFDVLRELGLWNESWIVFTADHGEELGRAVPNGEGGTMHYWGHSRYLFDSSLHVPLIIRPPRSHAFAPRRTGTVVTTASIATTLLDAAGVPRPENLVGPLPLQSDDPYDEIVVSVSRSSLKPVDVVSVRTSEWRLIETRKPERSIQLYRYRDGDESPDLAASETDRVAELLEQLRAVEPEGSVLREEISITDRERERLEALGYVE